MQRDDVIRLAREAGARPAGMGHYTLPNNDCIERFARLVQQTTEPGEKRLEE